MPDFAWLNEQTDATWRFLHGVGPEPRTRQTARERPRYHPPALPGTLPAAPVPLQPEGQGQ